VLQTASLAAAGCTACCVVMAVVSGRTNLGVGGGSSGSRCGGAANDATAAVDRRWGRRMEASVLISRWESVADVTVVRVTVVVRLLRAWERRERRAGSTPLPLAGFCCKPGPSCF